MNYLKDNIYKELSTTVEELTEQVQNLLINIHNQTILKATNNMFLRAHA